MEQVDTLIHARWLIPIEADKPLLENHSLAIKAGRIHDILTTRDARQRYQAKDEFTLEQHAVLPGLVNAHGHAAMSLFRGMADDLQLMTWLNDHIWPAEGKWVSESFVHDGSELAMAEMLLSGTTCFTDMYFFPNVTASLAEKVGIRACVGMIVIDLPTQWGKSADEYIKKGLDLHQQVENMPLVKTSWAPHAPYTVSDAPLAKIAELSEQLDVPIQIHVHETAFEVSESEKQLGMRPLARLKNLDLLSPRMLAVHMTQLLPSEIEEIATAGVHVAHCPESNMKLASGACPVEALLEAGVNVALGSDGAASNNDLDLFGEMHSAALLGKLTAGDAAAVSAHSALRMATLNGAKALGLGHEIGSLKIGKAADVIAVDMGHLLSQPIYNPISHLVYANRRNHVSHAWVAGNTLVADGQLLTIDSEALSKKCQAWQNKVQNH